MTSSYKQQYELFVLLTSSNARFLKTCCIDYFLTTFTENNVTICFIFNYGEMFNEWLSPSLIFPFHASDISNSLKLTYYLCLWLRYIIMIESIEFINNLQKRWPVGCISVKDNSLCWRQFLLYSFVLVLVLAMSHQLIKTWAM